MKMSGTVLMAEIFKYIVTPSLREEMVKKKEKAINISLPPTIEDINTLSDALVNDILDDLSRWLPENENYKRLNKAKLSSFIFARCNYLADIQNVTESRLGQMYPIQK
jgi:hypothetical protein